MTKRAFLICGALAHLASSASPLHAQGSETKVAEDRTLANIAYYPAEVSAQDTYIRQRCRLDAYVPAQAKNFATVVWFHGGGLKQGQKSIPEDLRDQGLAVVAANYRLSPKAKCPAYLEDAAAAVAWTFKHIAEHGGNPERIYVAGHSAGGYLATMVVLDKSYLAEHGIDSDKIAGLFSYSGQCLTHFTIREEAGLAKQQGLADRFAPIHHVRANTPPIVLYNGQRDLEMAARYEENALLCSMLKAAGHRDVQLHEVMGADHNSMVIPAHLLMLAHLQGIPKTP